MVTMCQTSSTSTHTPLCTCYGDNVSDISSTSTPFCTRYCDNASDIIYIHTYTIIFVQAMVTMYQISSISTYTPFRTRYGDNVSGRSQPHPHHSVHAIVTMYQISSTSTSFRTRYGDNVSDIIHIHIYTILYMLR